MTWRADRIGLSICSATRRISTRRLRQAFNPDNATRSDARLAPLWNDLRRPLRIKIPHIDLAGDGGGDEGGAAFEEEVDSNPNLSSTGGKGTSRAPGYGPYRVGDIR